MAKPPNHLKRILKFSGNSSTFSKSKDPQQLCQRQFFFLSPFPKFSVHTKQRPLNKNKVKYYNFPFSFTFYLFPQQINKKEKKNFYAHFVVSK